MKLSFVALAADGQNTEYCKLSRVPAEMTPAYRPARAIAMGDKYTAVLDFHMSPRFGGKKIADRIDTTFGYFIASDRLKRMIEVEVDPAQAEYLPIHIVDHKEKRILDRYWIVNLLFMVDCIDLPKSEYVKDPMIDDRLFFMYLKKLVLDPERVPSDRRIFRLPQMPAVHLVREDLLAEMTTAGITGQVAIPQGDPMLM